MSDHPTDHSSHHAEAVHPVGAIIMALILAVLIAFGIGLMNEGKTAALVISGLAFLGFALYAIFGLGKVETE